MNRDKKQRHYNYNKNNAKTNKDKMENNVPEPDSPNLDNISESEEIKPEIVDNFDDVEEVDTDSAPEGTGDCSGLEKEVEELKLQVEKEKKEYLFLMAEFDNFRKRTLKEKSEIIKNAGENVFKGLLPIVDDMERGIKASENATDVETVREGLILIYNKLKKFMEQNGVKEYDSADDNFDPERHEAITAVPVHDEKQKGKILDTIEKGYTINDKVLRHARVVVGQ